MKVLIILAAIIIFFILLLSIPVYISLDYTDTAKASVKWLFLKYKLYPFPKKKKSTDKKPDEEKPKEEVNEEKKEEKPKIKKNGSFISDFYECQGLSGILNFICICASKLKKYSSRLLKSIYIKNLNIDISITKDDAAQTAIYYGKVCSAVYPSLGFITSNVSTKDYHVNILADYCGDKTRYKFSSVIGIIPVKVINSSIAFGFTILIHFLRVVINNVKIKNNKLKGGN